MARYDDIEELEPNLDGRGLRIGIVLSRFNQDVGEGLLSACTAALAKQGVRTSDMLIVSVPGALEVPLALQKLANTGRYDALIALGAVIRGETYHFEVVANESASGITTVALDSGVPVANGILTTNDDDGTFDNRTLYTHDFTWPGTGGTLTGVGRRLHRHDPNVKVIAAEPELGDLVYGLRSLEDGFVPPIFDETVLARKFLVTSSDSLRATRDLTEREGIFAGISSGAVIHVARRVASELGQGDIVCLLADGGWKYLSTQAWAPEIERAEKGVSESLWW